MGCITYANLCPASGDPENVLLQKILLSLNQGGGGSGGGVTGLSVDGGPFQTGNVSITTGGGSALLNFTDENANADGVVWSSAGTVETFRTVGATNNVRFAGAAQRLHTAADTSLLSFLGSFNKATGAFLEVYGQNHGTGLGGAAISIHDGGAFKVLSAPINSTASVLRFSVDGTTGDTSVILGRTLLPNTTSAALGGIYFGGARAIHNFGTTNIFVGAGAGNFTLTGSINVGVGNDTLSALTTGTQNTAVGVQSLLVNTTGSFNAGLGSATLFSNVSGTFNTAFGYAALFSNISGMENVAIGALSLLANTGGFNVAVGYSALTANTTGVNSVAVGRGALSSATDGNNNIAIGTNAGNNITSGANNIVIGHDIDSPTATNVSTLTLGNLLFGTGLDGAGTVVSTGNIGVGIITPFQKLSVLGAIGAYEALTDSSNYSRTSITPAAGNHQLRTEAAGTGTLRILQVGTGPSTGTNIAGVNSIFHSGQPTGNALPGAILFQQGLPVGASGAGVTALATIWQINTVGSLAGGAGFAFSTASGTNQRAGNATLVAGTVTVANTSVTANTIVLLTRKTSGGTIGTAVTYTVSPTTSFTITADSALDTSTFSYFLIEVP